MSRGRAWIGPALVLGAAAALLALERRHPLRAPTQPTLRRDLQNFAIAAVGGLGMMLLHKPLLEPFTRAVQRRRWGLLNRLGLPPWLRAGIALALMDYTLYVWHVLNHRIRALWRIHVVHHADLDLSASTAFRFHFAELMLSVPWRALQVLMIGTSPRELRLWQQLTLLSILFHHSNLRLPARLDGFLTHIIATPRLHGIHHAAVRDCTDANWTSGLTLWDRLHGTLRRAAPPPEVPIGVPAFRDPEGLTAAKSLALPFVAQPASWRWPPGRRPRTPRGRIGPAPG